MNKKTKLKKILEALSPSVEFQQFDESVNKLKSELKDKIHAKTLDDVNSQLERFRKRIDLTPLVDAVGGLESATNNKIRAVADLLAQEIESLRQLESEDRATYEREVPPIAGNIQALREELQALTLRKDSELVDIQTQLSGLSEFSQEAERKFSKIEEKLADDDGEIQLASEVAEELEQLRKELNSRINTLGGSVGGGNANRNIAIGGVTTALSTFTDINLKAGSNVTITYAKNQTTKYTDITIAATGGGGGTVRSINSVSVPTAAGDAAGTDYVYLVSGTTTITLPTAVANTNLYTIKNVGVGVVTVAFTGGETCDGSATLTLPVQYTSVDLISDGFGWNVT